MKVTSLPVSKQFKLETDPDGTGHVTIAQATFAQDRTRSELLKTQRYSFDDRERTKSEMIQEVNPRDLQALEVYLTITSAEGIVDENEQPLFKFNTGATGVSRPANQAEFMAALGRMPTDVVEEIHKYVREVNPSWGPRKSEGTEGEFPGGA